MMEKYSDYVSLLWGSLVKRSTRLITLGVDNVDCCLSTCLGTMTEADSFPASLLVRFPLALAAAPASFIFNFKGASNDISLTFSDRFLSSFVSQLEPKI